MVLRLETIESIIRPKKPGTTIVSVVVVVSVECALLVLTVMVVLRVEKIEWMVEGNYVETIGVLVHDLLDHRIGGEADADTDTDLDEVGFDGSVSTRLERVAVSLKIFFAHVSTSVLDQFSHSGLIFGADWIGGRHVDSPSSRVNSSFYLFAAK